MKISRELLIRFSRNECTAEERQAVSEWLDDGRFPFPGEGEEAPDDVRREVWRALKDRIGDSSGKVVKMRMRNNHLFRIAAVLLVILGTAAFFYYQRDRDPVGRTVYLTGMNERAKVVLPDSSVVFLSPNSSIRLLEPFAKDKREIALEGQAVFEVAQDPLRPFTVISGEVSTTALGTSFKVTSFPGRNHINVVLSYGKVVVKDHSKKAGAGSFVLDPGEEVRYDKTTHTLQKIDAAASLFDYKNNILYFKDAGVKEVAEKLKQYYHVEVRYNALQDVNWCVSGEFDYQPLDIVMKTIAYSCNINYVIKGNAVILTPKGQTY